MAVSSVVALKTLLILLTCVMTVTLVYGFAKDYFTSCFDPKARWMQVGLLDFCIDVSFIAAWFFYKESRWILRLVFIFILFWFGSATICGYILIQLFKLSPEESLKDPIYFVLVRRQKRDGIGHTGLGSVVSARVIYASLGCLMLGALVFVSATDGSPFRAQVFSPCMVPLLTDLCIHVVVFSLWVAYKESSLINAFLWILLIVCFGSMGICAYVVKELFYLSPEEPLYLVLFSKRSRDMMLSDPLLTHHGDV